MNILRVFFLGLLLFCVGYANAQFNTIRIKKDIEEIEAKDKGEEKVIEDIEPESKDSESVTKSKDVLEAKMDYWNRRRYLSLPIDSMVITSYYGERKDPFTGKTAFHKGIDFRGNNDYVYSVMPGIVVKTGKNKSLGNYVKVKHGDFTTLYAHLYNVLVNEKQNVDAGQPVGVSGSTGRSTGEHLHFQVYHNGKVIDPKPLLDYISEVMRVVKKEMSDYLRKEGIYNKGQENKDGKINQQG